MKLTPDYIALMAIIITGIGFLWNKLDQIRNELAEISKNAVTHSICNTRRKECPCVKEVAELKSRLQDDEHLIFGKTTKIKGNES